MLPFRITNRPPNPNGGAWIFGLQLLLVILVPILDDGAPLAPLAYVAVLLGVLAATVYLLGYRRTAATIAAGSKRARNCVSVLPARNSGWRRMPASNSRLVRSPWIRIASRAAASRRAAEVRSGACTTSLASIGS